MYFICTPTIKSQKKLSISNVAWSKIQSRLELVKSHLGFAKERGNRSEGSGIFAALRTNAQTCHWWATLAVLMGGVLGFQ